MSAYLYDEALVERLRAITGDNRIHIVPPEDAISFLAQLSKDKVNYPAIVLSRGPIDLREYRNQVVALKGQTAKIDENNIIHKAKLIPIRIEWSIDVFTVDRFTCDEIIRELVFYFITYPRFEVKVPYDLDISQNFDVFINPSITDNSDLIEFPNKGEFFRQTITIYTENAHFFSSSKQFQINTLVKDVDLGELNNQSNKGDE